MLRAFATALIAGVSMSINLQCDKPADRLLSQEVVDVLDSEESGLGQCALAVLQSASQTADTGDADTGDADASILAQTSDDPMLDSLDELDEMMDALDEERYIGGTLNRLKDKLELATDIDYEVFRVHGVRGHTLPLIRLSSSMFEQEIHDPPVVLMHDAQDEAADFAEPLGWALNLARYGYEVWLAHGSQSAPTSYIGFKRYDENWTDYSKADVPAIVDKVIEKTVTDWTEVTWIGVGRGASALHTALTDNHPLESNIAKFIALQPCIFRETRLPASLDSLNSLRLLQFAFKKAGLKKLGGYHFAQQLKSLKRGIRQLLNLAIAALKKAWEILDIEPTPSEKDKAMEQLVWAFTYVEQSVDEFTESFGFKS